MKFAIWILILLGVLSLTAMFVNEFYDPRRMAMDSTQLQATIRGALDFLQMDDAFRSWWYRLLLGVLCLSLFACVWKRLPIIWRVWTNPPPDLRLVQQLPSTIHRDTELPKEELLKKIGGWRFRVKKESHWIGERARLGMWGPLMTHLGMLLLGIGALVTSFGNYSVRMGGYAGDLVELDVMPFTVRIDSFRVTYYPLQPGQTVLVDNSYLGRLLKPSDAGNWLLERWTQQGIATVEIEPERIRNRFDNDRDRGNIQKYSSYVTIFKDGAPLRSTEVAVNDPLRQDGFRFYQSSYDAENPRFEAAYDSVAITMLDSAAGFSQTVYLQPRETIAVPNDTLTITTGRLLPDFKIGRNNVKFSGSDEFINPGLELTFESPHGYRETFWLLLNFEQNNQPGKYDYRLSSLYGERATEEMATIFEIKYTAGTWILWLGFIVSTIGLLLSFYITHKTLYIAWPEGARTSTFLIGVSRKMPLEFEKDLDRMLGRL